ncbi:MAG: L-serine ammonia-lyase [Clostridia bacterium]|nr:L-serine ammonia-lyase [Clostridia bacterium]
MNEFLPEKLKSLRKKQGLTQMDLSSLLGVSDRAVSKWEKGLSSPTSKHIVFLAKVFNVSVEYFFNNGRDKTTPVQKEGMESLCELYKIGRGPSSSHTIGPEKACSVFKEKNKNADFFKVTLYGSLAKTGKGHCSDEVIKKTFSPVCCEVEFNYLETNLPHPNTMDIKAFKNGEQIDSTRVQSVGGGSIVFDDNDFEKPKKVYKLSHFAQIAEYCKEKNIRLWEFALENEEPNFIEYMHDVWQAMKNSIKKGLNDEGILPGGLDVRKKAKSLMESQHIDETRETHENRVVCAYAFAVSEQNASGEIIVTAPTCGSAGVVPAVLYYKQQKNGYSDFEIVKALITAGIIGNIIKTNASISGAECGCQAEIGSACAMASAALGELFDLSIDKIEYAAEIAIEHHLGLTCDPICGLVQIPCIERNAVAAMRAINAVSLASFLWDSRKISFDRVVQTMKETGHDLSSSYKETSEAGLAKIDL